MKTKPLPPGLFFVFFVVGIGLVLATVLGLMVLVSESLDSVADRGAPPQEWYVAGFDARVTVHGSGTVETVETITYDFGGEPSHGLTRELPETGWIDGYGWRDFGLSDVRAASGELPVAVLPGEGDSDGESWTAVRVGDFDTEPELTGTHTFEISYVYERLTAPGGEGAAGGVQYYADVVGTGWSVPVRTAAVSLSLPDLAGESERHEALEAKCYAGNPGERDGCDTWAWADPDSADPLLRAESGELAPGQAMSVELTLPSDVYTAEPTGPDEGVARLDPPGEEALTGMDLFLPVTFTLVALGLLWLGVLGLIYLGSRFFDLDKDGSGGRSSPVGSARGGGAGAGGGGGGGAGGGGGGGGGG